jgi:hypothetical protein
MSPICRSIPADFKDLGALRKRQKFLFRKGKHREAQELGRRERWSQALPDPRRKWRDFFDAPLEKRDLSAKSLQTVRVNLILLAGVPVHFSVPFLDSKVKVDARPRDESNGIAFCLDRCFKTQRAIRMSQVNMLWPFLRQSGLSH